MSCSTRRRARTHRHRFAPNLWEALIVYFEMDHFHLMVRQGVEIVSNQLVNFESKQHKIDTFRDKSSNQLVKMTSWSADFDALSTGVRWSLQFLWPPHTMRWNFRGPSGNVRNSNSRGTVSTCWAGIAILRTALWVYWSYMNVPVSQRNNHSSVSAKSRRSSWR